MPTNDLYQNVQTDASKQSTPNPRSGAIIVWIALGIVFWVIVIGGIVVAIATR